MNYTRDIKKNISRVKAGIDAKRYPVLSSFLERKNSRLKQDLLSVLGYMAANKATTLYGGLRYWEVTEDLFMQLYGGTKRPWQSHLVFFALSGLILRVKPSSQTKNREMAAAYNAAVKDGKDPAIFYSSQLYTAARMAQIEAQAQRFKARGVSLSDIRKTDVIALYGQETANLFYQDERTVSGEDREAAQLIIAAIQEQIAARGYAIKAAAIQAAQDKAAESRDTLQKIQHQAAQLTGLCQDHGLVYRRANKEECRAWGLSYGAKIIVAQNPPL